MKTYTFNKTDSGYIGKAFEMAVKDALKRKNANRVSPCGQTDFRFDHKCYEVKQNGSCVKYSNDSGYIKGSNRVIYATHIAYNVVEETMENISITVDLASTEMFILDRNDFIAYLETVNGIKINASRGTANIQTCYNYKKDAYHGRLGRRIEEWGSENVIVDEFLGIIWDSLE